MSDAEPIILIGGPADGELHWWDGGDYFEAITYHPTRVFNNAQPDFKKTLTRNHVYKRDPRLRDTVKGAAVFRWQGEPK